MQKLTGFLSFLFEKTLAIYSIQGYGAGTVNVFLAMVFMSLMNNTLTCQSEILSTTPLSHGIAQMGSHGCFDALCEVSL